MRFFESEIPEMAPERARFHVVPVPYEKTVSYGKERPLEVCSVEACYSKNRRAVTVIGVGAGV